MELVLIGLGGCSGYDVVHILEKGRQAMEDVAAEAAAQQEQEDPRHLPAFTWISFRVKERRLDGEG